MTSLPATVRLVRGRSSNFSFVTCHVGARLVARLGEMFISVFSPAGLVTRARFVVNTSGSRVLFEAVSRPPVQKESW